MLIQLVISVSLLCSVLGCGGAANRWATYDPDFRPNKNTKVAIDELKDLAPLENRESLDENFDPVAELQRKIESKLGALHASDTSDASSVLYLKLRIMDYEPGDAFLRWWNFTGMTVLTVYCDVYQHGKKEGTIKARRTIEMGGIYSIGQWKHIFGAIAGDIVSELKAKVSESQE